MRIVVVLCFMVSITSCGAPTSSDLKIVGGRVTNSDDVGYSNAVALLYDAEIRCTGSLIDGSRILTAAHCFADGENAEHIRIVFDRDIFHEIDDTNSKEASSLRLHEDYDFPNYDVAIIGFEGEPLNGYQPLPLHNDRQGLTTGRGLVFTGFGVTAVGSMETAGVMRTVDSTLREYQDNDTFSGLIFSGPAPGKGVCSGDSGGPVYMIDGERWMIIGIHTGLYPVVPAKLCQNGAGYHNWTGFHYNWVVNVE